MPNAAANWSFMFPRTTIPSIFGFRKFRLRAGTDNGADTSTFIKTMSVHKLTSGQTEADELQDMMAGSRDLAQLEGSLGDTV
ncbi:MAG: hypothetical protein OXK82_03865 [Deltaproteobacteria bacterium]|nr:hypothetical protein [Deltaproteobacteria bacterium]